MYEGGERDFLPISEPDAVAAKPPAYNKKSTLTAVILTGLGIITAAVIIWALCVAPVTSVQTGIQPYPVIAETGGEVWLLCGGDSVSLGSNVYYMEPPYSAGVRGKISGLISQDNRYLYYLDDYVRTRGKGTLMRVSADALSEPEKISSGVCAVMVSADGESALYLKNISGESGRLYVYKNGASSEASESVYIRGFGFSPDGQSFYYYTKSDETYGLYLNHNGRKQKVYETEHFNREIILNNEGEMLYKVKGAHSNTLYLYSDGKSDEIADGADFFMMLNNGEDYLYTAGNYGGTTLYYKAQGKEAEDIFKSDSWIMPLTWVSGGILQGDTILLAERGGIKGGCAIYEAVFTDEPQMILIADEADEYGYGVNADSTCVTFRKNGQSYIAPKKDGEWSEPVLLCKDTLEGIWFDREGEYVYWLDTGESALWSYDLSTGERRQLLEDVDSFILADDVPCGVSNLGDVYKAENGSAAKLLENAYTPLRKTTPIHSTYHSQNSSGSHYWTLVEQGYTLLGTKGGLYVVTDDYDIVYLSNSSYAGEKIIEGADTLLYPAYQLFQYYYEDEDILYGMLPYEVLTKDDEASLQNCYEDILYYRDIICGTSDAPITSPHGTPEEDYTLVREIARHENIPYDIEKITDWFYNALSETEYWMDNKGSIDIRNNALSNIRYATYYYERYIGIDQA